MTYSLEKISTGVTLVVPSADTCVIYLMKTPTLWQERLLWLTLSKFPKSASGTHVKLLSPESVVRQKGADIQIPLSVTFILGQRLFGQFRPEPLFFPGIPFVVVAALFPETR